MRPILLPLLALAATPAAAASFDCAAARLPDERAICAARPLNDRDVRLDAYYRLARRLVPMGGRDALIRDQSAWLARRHRCAADRACLLRLYDRRLAALDTFFRDRVIARGPF